MLDLPRPVLEYLYALTVGIRSPAYLLIQKNGRLLDWGGNLEVYGITNLQKGEIVEEKLFFLQGLLPIDSSPLFLSCVKTEDEMSADIHIFPGDEGDWVLLLDATWDEIQQSVVQQKGNELSLIREKQSKILNQYLGKDVAESLAQGAFTLEQKGERRNVTIMFADICGFTPYSEKHPPEIVFKTLNLYLPAMIQPILDEAGMVDKLIGDAVMGIFGVLASSESPPKQAIKAALQMINAVREVSKALQAQNKSTFKISIGIASGSVALGILGSKDRRTFTAIGHHVNLAARLEGQARPCEILIDENTFKKIEEMQNNFLATTLSFKGIAEPKPVYSWVVKG
ncbi:MAG: adenylate/guanylate cyclase domain-containing protein [Coleofasciculus sp. Co-bin14]|nr:adenylate/guanylate cyclase domain-containing protein [Coleofasciculus sp. Co-bin14]